MAESTRWYLPSGERAPDAIHKGKTKAAGHDIFKPPGLAEARVHGYFPSVTSITKQLDKPGLKTYFANQNIQAAFQAAPRKDDQSIKEYYAMVRKAGQKHGNDAADEGTAIHTAIYEFFENSEVSAKHVNIIESVNELCKSLVPADQHDGWETEVEFASPLGYAGTIDLLHRRARIFLDWKTKEEVTEKTKPYEDTLFQIAPYSRAISIDQGVADDTGAAPCDCYCITISREKDEDGVYTGDISIHQYSDDEIQRGYEVFLRLLEIFFIRNNYFPV